MRQSNNGERHRQEGYQEHEPGEDEHVVLQVRPQGAVGQQPLRPGGQPLLVPAPALLWVRHPHGRARDEGEETAEQQGALEVRFAGVFRVPVQGYCRVSVYGMRGDERRWNGAEGGKKEC